jgi:hypothetical protein
MSLFALDGADGIDVRLSLPRYGAWHADVSADVTSGAVATSGKVVLDLDGTRFTGTVRRGGVTADTGVYRMVGGAGALGQVATPKAYAQVTPQVVLQDVLGAAGESLSSSVAPSLLAASWASWTTPAWPVGQVLTEVAARLGVGWRLLADGTVWLGAETWPLASPDCVEWRRDDRLGRRYLHLLEGSMLLPGTTYAGGQVEYVQVTSDGGRFEAEVWLA